MSSLFRAVVEGLFGLKDNQLVAVEDLASAIRNDRKGSVPETPIEVHLNREVAESTDQAVKRVGKEAAKRTRAKTKKTKPKDFDPAKVLANRKPGRGKGSGAPPHEPKPYVDMVREALEQTTGMISSVDLAEVLEIPRPKVSNALNGLWNRKEVHREATKHTLDDGRTIPVYVYKLKD